MKTCEQYVVRSVNQDYPKSVTTGMTGFDRWIRFLPYACRVYISARTHRYTPTSANLVTRVKTAIASAFAAPQLAAVVA